MLRLLARGLHFRTLQPSDHQSLDQSDRWSLSHQLSKIDYVGYLSSSVFSFLNLLLSEIPSIALSMVRLVFLSIIKTRPNNLIVRDQVSAPKLCTDSVHHCYHVLFEDFSHQTLRR